MPNASSEVKLFLAVITVAASFYVHLYVGMWASRAYPHGDDITILFKSGLLAGIVGVPMGLAYFQKSRRNKSLNYAFAILWALIWAAGTSILFFLIIMWLSASS